MKLNTHLLRLSLFSPISRQKAADIVCETITSGRKSFRVLSRKPANVHIYNLPSEPCWFVIAPWGDDLDGKLLRGSRVL
jgi:hypothetical protein